MVLLTSPPFVAVNLAIASPKSTGTFSYLIKICCRTIFHVSICHHTQSTLIVVLTSLTSTHLPRPRSHQPPTAPHYSETTNGDVYKRYSSPFRIPPPFDFFLRKKERKILFLRAQLFMLEQLAVDSPLMMPTRLMVISMYSVSVGKYTIKLFGG